MAVIVLVIAVGAGIGYYFAFDTVREKNVDMLKKEGMREVNAEDVAYFNNTKGYYASPKEPGNYPGVVMVHEWWGLNENIKDMARQLAAEGYQVLAVDLYKGEVAETRDRAQELRTALTQEEALENMIAATRYLRDMGANKVASLGWCFGGGKSLELALSGEQMDATVIYYGSLVTDASELKKITWPVLGIFGDQDTSIPVETVKQFRSALMEARVVHEIYTYTGVGHAFANPTGQSYAPEQTEDAWAKTLTFLKKHLQ